MKRLTSLIILFLLALCAAIAWAGTVTIRTVEWDLPTADCFPFDVTVSPDGKLWFTELRANKLGRLDPKSGAVREFPLRVPDSGPRGIVADDDGFIWFTSGSRGYIGRLDPDSGKITEYSLPEPNARDPQDIAMDENGIFWFTVRTGNYVGRLDSQAGKIRLQPLATPKAQPSGIAINSQGVPFFCESGTNRIGRINPQDMTITEFILPEGARPRRLAVASDDSIYYTDYRRGFLGQLNPANAKVREWASPGGPKSAPYSITITPDDMVWYSESGVTPDAVVRFDPRTQKLARWFLPTADGIRNMVSSPKGDIYVTGSASNSVGAVRIEK